MQPPRALAERVRLGQLARLGDDLGVPAAGEIGLDAPLEREYAQLLEPRPRPARRRLLGEVGERRAAPERERLARARRRRLGWSALVERDAAAVRRAARSGRGRARPARPATRVAGVPRVSIVVAGRAPCAAARRSSAARSPQSAAARRPRGRRRGARRGRPRSAASGGRRAPLAAAARRASPVGRRRAPPAARGGGTRSPSGDATPVDCAAAG